MQPLVDKNISNVYLHIFPNIVPYRFKVLYPYRHLNVFHTKTFKPIHLLYCPLYFFQFHILLKEQHCGSHISIFCSRNYKGTQSIIHLIMGLGEEQGDEWGPCGARWMTKEFSDVSYADSTSHKRGGTSPLMPFHKTAIPSTVRERNSVRMQ